MNTSGTFNWMPSYFILTGLSWVSDQKLTPVISTFYLLMYIAVVVMNCGIIALVKYDHKLHKPMHILIALLALQDLTVATLVIPKVLSILWCGDTVVSATGCLTQMLLLYSMYGTASSLFAFMSLDRYVAICHPLRHSTIMSNSLIIKVVLFIILRNMLLLVPIPVLTHNLIFCKSIEIAHSFCEYVDVIKLTCGDLTPSIIFMVTIICLIPGSDNSIMAFSYTKILKVVYSLKSSEARWKALNTCSAHVIMLSLFYVSSCIPLVLFVFYSSPPRQLKMLQEIFSCLLLPVINPLVYGLRTKEIQEGFKRCYLKLLVF